MSKENFENWVTFEKEINRFLKRKFECPNCNLNKIIYRKELSDFYCPECHFSICPILKPKKEKFKLFEDYPKEIQQFVNDWKYHISTLAPRWFSVITKQTNKLTEQQKSEWAELFRKLREIDKHSKPRIQAVLLELFKPQGKFFEFWIEKGNIRTPLKLREKMKSKNWKGVSYFEFFLSQLGVDDSEQETKFKAAWN